MNKIDAPEHLSRVPQPPLTEVSDADLVAEANYWAARADLYSPGDPALRHYHKLIRQCRTELELRGNNHA
jgi:hypothetical protein